MNSIGINDIVKCFFPLRRTLKRSFAVRTMSNKLLSGDYCILPLQPVIFQCSCLLLVYVNVTTYVYTEYE